ncbi:response regulator [Pyxidicoccus fallax]|uniref:histidine kinase n=1 Tax=Pyxidicoccus fallax TaxID=394095 RepID=A0A848LSZ9_9BACT|nr:ATP-binding protein [Pyxidicoccus fallax]NMO20799.1 response regulator [Pyxidicoccus fallax]NPC81776.1 response regulator [Pyxidicoccus fallax]
MTVPAAQSPAPPSPDTPEISVRMLRALLLHYERTYGRARLERVWRREGLPLSLEYVETLTNFVSMHFTERLFEVLDRDSGDPDFITKAGRRIASPEAVGFLFYMMRATATPRSVYERALELDHTYNRVGGFRILQISDSWVKVQYFSRIRESNRNLCRARMANLSAFPTVWNLPLAEVKELQCQVEGAPCCEYECHWQNLPPLAWRFFTGGVVGMLAGLVSSTLDWAPPVFAAVSLGAAGVAVGAWLDTRLALRRKDAQLSEQHQGLRTSLEDLQRRNEEIFRANVALEDRVAERTQALSEANAKLEQALSRQKELDRLKSEFFDNVSHELRTPLTLILLTLESLQKRVESLPPVVEQHLSTMERSATRLLRLINHLLDLAQLESGKARLRYQPLELHGFLSTVLPPFFTMAERQGVWLKLEGAEVTPVQVDHERIDVVFQNLLSNALKFTQKGGVTVRVYEDATDVHVEVEDTGPGIAPQDVAVIFDRFAQADNSGTRRFGGTGIGLALVKETLELHLGGISVASELGKGSTFRVRLPKGTAHIREEIRERRRQDTLVLPVRRERRTSGAFPALETGGPAGTVSSSAPARDHAGPTPDAPRVLVVEDDAEIRRFIAGLLAQSYQVLEAVNGEEGRQRALTERPHLIVSDVMMPVMSGLQMLEALRADSRTVDVPIILLTARQEVSAKVEALGTGANDYLGKPFSPRELLARIETQLRLREAAVRAAENERLAAIGLLTSGFAHEVRNPLNGLMNALQPLKDMLATGASDAELGKAMLEVVEECGVRIRHLAESLLSFTRTSDTPVALSLDASLDSTLSVLAWKVPSGVTVERAYQCNEMLLGDPGTLNQVWLNLLDNALKAVGERGVVKVATVCQGDEAIVTIADNGVGIRKEDMERLFQPFFSTRAAGEGTGLGLALSRRIILRHGGRISLESTPGEGTRVEVRLPLRPPAVSASPASGDGTSEHRVGRLA